MKKITVKIEDVYVEEQYTFVNYLWQDVPVASHAQGRSEEHTSELQSR